MDLFDVVRSSIRRWYIVLPLMLVTGWFAYDAYSGAKPLYYANAVVGIAPPSLRIDQSAPGEPLRRNGLLDIGGAALIANMTAMGLSDPAVEEGVAAAGGKDYIARIFPTPGTMPQLPLIMIESNEGNPADTTKTLELVIAQADDTMKALQQQARVPEDQMVGPFVVSPPGTPVEGMPSRTRSTIAVFGAGAALSILLGVLVDVVLLRRKARPKKHREAEPETMAQPSLAGAPHDNHQPEGLSPAAEGVVGNR